MPEEKPGENKDEMKEMLSGVQEALSGLPKSMQESVMKGVTTALQQAAAQQTDDDFDDEDDPPAEVDLEAMSRRDFANAIGERVLAAVQKQLKGLEKEIQTSRQVAHRTDLKADLEKVKAEFPNFGEYEDELRALVKQYPDLGVRDLFLLARERNPEKTAELQKAADEKKAAEEAKKREEENPIFAGFTPTAMGVRSAEKGEPGRMDQKTAGNAAFEATMAHLPAELIGGSD